MGILHTYRNKILWIYQWHYSSHYIPFLITLKECLIQLWHKLQWLLVCMHSLSPRPKSIPSLCCHSGLDVIFVVCSCLCVLLFLLLLVLTGFMSHCLPRLLFCVFVIVLDIWISTAITCVNSEEFFHLPIYHSYLVSSSSGQILLSQQATLFYFYCLLSWIASKCIVIACGLFVLVCWSCSLLSIHHSLAIACIQSFRFFFAMECGICIYQVIQSVAHLWCIPLTELIIKVIFQDGGCALHVSVFL